MSSNKYGSKKMIFHQMYRKSTFSPTLMHSVARRWVWNRVFRLIFLTDRHLLNLAP